MILFYRQFFMLHSKKSILQVKIQRLRNYCRHVPSLKPFLRWKLKKKSKTGARWSLRPWVFAYTSATCIWKPAQRGGAWNPLGIRAAWILLVVGQLHHIKLHPPILGCFWQSHAQKLHPILKTNGQFGFGGAPQSFHALSWVPIAPHKAAPAHFGVFLAGPCPKKCIAPQFRPTRAPILKANGQFAYGVWLHGFCLLGANCTT